MFRVGAKHRAQPQPQVVHHHPHPHHHHYGIGDHPGAGPGPPGGQIFVNVAFDFEYIAEDGKKVFMKENEILLLINKTNHDWWHVSQFRRVAMIVKLFCASCNLVTIGLLDSCRISLSHLVNE